MNGKDIEKLIPTATQLEMLSKAFGRGDYNMHPVPERLKGCLGTNAIKSLISKGYVVQNGENFNLGEFGIMFCSTAMNMVEVDKFSKDEMLNVIEYSLEAAKSISDIMVEKSKEEKVVKIKEEECVVLEEKGMEKKDAKTPKKSQKCEKDKIVLDILSNPDGVSPDELIKATGWQPHSLRSWISRFNKKQKEANSLDRIILIKQGHNRFYRLENAE